MISKTRDVLAVRRLHKKIFPADAWSVDAKVSHYWIAYEADVPVGFIICQPTWAGDGWFVSWVGTLPGARGNRLAVHLIRAVERFVAKQTDPEPGLCTYVMAHNGASIVSFLRAGWRIFCPSEWWAGEGAVYFQKSFD